MPVADGKTVQVLIKWFKINVNVVYLFVNLGIKEY